MLRHVVGSSIHSRSICSNVKHSPGISRYSDRIRFIAESSGSLACGVLFVISSSGPDIRNNQTIDAREIVWDLPPVTPKAGFNVG